MGCNMITWSISNAINPCVAVAGGNDIGAWAGMVKGQIQGNQTIATRYISQRICGCVVAWSISIAVNPRIAVAGGNDIGAQAGMVKGQIQGNQAIATRYISQCICGCVVTWCVGNAVYPGIAVAGGNDIGAWAGMVDGKVDCNDAITTRYIGNGIWVCATDGPNVFPAGWCVAVAGIGGNGSFGGTGQFKYENISWI